MRTIGVIFGITAFAAVVFSPLPAAAFGIHLGPVHFGLPLVGAETNSEALESCAGLAQGVTNLPIDQIRQTVHPTADQEAALEDLSATSSLASDIIKSCPASAPLTPVRCR